MSKRRIIQIDTIAMLKHKHSEVEIHLKNDRFYQSPLNLFQILMWKMLGFDYIYGVSYVDLMLNRLKG